MKPAVAFGVGVLLLAVTAAVSIGLGTPTTEAVRAAAIAGTAGVVVGALGTGLLKLLERATLTAQISAPVIIVLCVIALGALAGVNALFSGQQLRALAMLLVAGGVVGVVLALMFAEDIREASQGLQETVREIASGTAGAQWKPGIPELAELAAELQRTSVQLDEARRRERAQDQSRRELVTWVSHDLRAPLQRIRAAADALEDGVFDDAHSLEALHATVRIEADRLGRLIDDLFQLSRIEAGALELRMQPVALADLVSEVLAAVAPTAAAKGVALEGGAGGHVPQLCGSPAHLTRALANLLDNAVRETPPGGTVTTAIGAEPGVVVVMIDDECGGMAPEQLLRLSAAAEAGHGPGSQGGGLGLRISWGLVRAHGGDIRVANHNGGCRFQIRLPVAGS
ncbi:MAG TPA: HAMP domain-containing sensor histidine kinase [Egibacteraceae bacterium]|nr:HAMP domain-containing sensor histidine kinase [Egibacteraceae bacterium]